MQTPSSLKGISRSSEAVIMNMDLIIFSAIILNAGDVVPVNPGSLLFFGLLTIAIGLVSIIRPQLFWYLRIGRKLPGIDPHRYYLLVLRFGGVLVIAIGLVMLNYARLSGG